MREQPAAGRDLHPNNHAKDGSLETPSGKLAEQLLAGQNVLSSLQLVLLDDVLNCHLKDLFTSIAAGEVQWRQAEVVLITIFPWK